MMDYTNYNKHHSREGMLADLDRRYFEKYLPLSKVSRPEFLRPLALFILAQG
jgi:hypothetical protein